MKIQFGFDDDVYGTVTSKPDGTLVYEGDESRLKKFIRSTHEEGEMALLTALKMYRGRFWCVELEEGS